MLSRISSEMWRWVVSAILLPSLIFSYRAAIGYYEMHWKLSELEKQLTKLETNFPILTQMSSDMRVMATQLEYQGQKIDKIEKSVDDLKRITN